MSNVLSIEEIKKKHDELYTEILQKGANLEKKKSKNNYLIDEVEKLLEDIKKLSETVDLFEDYRWLSDAAIKWQSVFSTIFESPRIIMLSQPKKTWMPSVPSVFSEEEINNWIKKQAAFIFYAQRAELGSQDSNDSENWRIAEVYFASEVLEGQFNFASRISPNPYRRLEKIWLKDVKCLMAYFKWSESRRDFSYFNKDKDYFNACEHIRNMLINEKIKARSNEFNNVQNYIQNHYLDDNGKIRFPPKQGTDLHKLIEIKAQRIYETTGESDKYINWLHAETYVKLFYENIIPAVTKKDKEKVLRVLKSLQFSKMNHFIIINSFETALAIYFLDQQIIQKLWDDSAKMPYPPESTVESIVNVDSWPQNFEIEEACKERFWFDCDKIGFRCVMLDIEKMSIINALKIAESGKPKEKHIKAIEELYNKSRTIHKETTL